MLSKLQHELDQYQKLSQKQGQAIASADINKLKQLIQEKENIITKIKSIKEKVSAQALFGLDAKLLELKNLDDKNIEKLKKLKAKKASNYQQVKEKDQALKHYAKHEN